VNQEKVLGYFIFWPEAAEPWITFTDGMNPPEFYEGSYSGNFEEDTFNIYPGRSIKATAFQAQGVSKVEFSLHYYDVDNKEIIDTPIVLSYLEKAGVTLDYTDNTKTALRIRAEERPNGGYSTIFPWDFTPPPRSGNYAVRARAFDFNETPSTVYYEAVFIVKDITFPDFPVPPAPAASDPLFKKIENNKITISGIVSDATWVESLYLVWINPQSRSYAAMSQLSYFRDANYKGWREAVERDLADGESMEDDTFDKTHRNRVWKVAVEHIGEDNGTKWNTLGSWAVDKKLDKWDIWEGDIDPTYRQLFYYELEIDITEYLNIAGVGADADLGKNQPLTSQVFLFRAGNPDGKCTIITYTPQGDTLSPSIAIQRVIVTQQTQQNESRVTTCIPREFQQVPQFEAGDRIQVFGTWREDSTEYLSILTYLTPNVEFEINGTKVPGTLTPGDGFATSGTFLIDVIVTRDDEVGGILKLSSMKDTLVVNATIKDVGGNPAETGNSWLIESDTLRFLRISSLDEDKAYKAGDKIEIFLEFNKPVTLKNQGSSKPVLILNTTGTASYGRKDEQQQTNENTRHYFTYTVGLGENTPANEDLNVVNIDDSLWEDSGYLFTWVNRGLEGKTEEIRITMISGHNGGIFSKPNEDEFYARALPVTTDIENNEYPFTLIGGKRITVDNEAPTITGFSASPQGWHPVGADIYITATFDEMVRLGVNPPGVDPPPYITPYLILGTGNNGTTSTDLADIRVNNKQITFRYTVKTGDTTGTGPLQVTGFGGNILDIPGTRMTAFTMRTLTGVYIDTTAPPTPTIAVFSGTSPNGTEKTPIPVNLYDDDVFIRVTGTPGAQNLGRIEYSLDGGQNWKSSTSNPNATINDSTATINEQLVNKGSYTIHARQIDQAGNESGTMSTTTFTRDPGSLITRISSTSPNGTYTHVAGRNLINVTVTFRKPLTFSGGQPVITHNARTNGTVTTNMASGVSSLSFDYTVSNGDAASPLDVTNFSGTTVTDAQGVDVRNYLTLPTAADAKLAGNKVIIVETGPLTNTAPTFINETTSPWTTTDQTSANYQGIRSDDGSYWTTLVIPFNHAISKGDGEITIEQIAGTGNTAYRLPAVITEAQYNRFRDVSGFLTYYTKGTNGYIYDGNVSNSRSDTSAKYVLNYQYNPDSAVTVNNNAFQGDSFIPAEFFTAFRQKEKITINVNSQAVEISGDNTLKVRLTGANAPQVPGATYTVTVPTGSVNDNLGSSNTEINADVTLGGVARPFIRIKKMQDTISARQTASNTTPSFTAIQPSYAYVRMDSRTPNSTIHYRAQGTTYNETAVNWSNTGNPPTASSATYPANTVTEEQYSPPYSGDNLYGIRIGNNAVGGYKWWVRAHARLVGSNNSAESHEMAYRTAITYRLMGVANGNNSTDMVNPIGNAAGTTAQRRIYDGDQIWIRGGDSIGSSSIPGFPFTWEDDFTSLKDNQKRAGIRLMTKVNNTTHTGGGNQNQLWNSQWQFLTWDINATAYVDFILGRDQNYNETDTQNGVNTQFYPSSNENEVWQYGPRYWALQRAGWSALKTQYPIFPGEHRWVNTGTNLPSTDNPVNYANAFKSRPSAGTNPTTGWSVTYPNPNTN